MANTLHTYFKHVLPNQVRIIQYTFILNYFLTSVFQLTVPNQCKIAIANVHVLIFLSSACTPSYCAQPGQNSPNQLDGAMVGGPGRNDDYQDRRDDYVKNEVSVISNAVFQTAVAGKNAKCH